VELAAARERRDNAANAWLLARTLLQPIRRKHSRSRTRSKQSPKLACEFQNRLDAALCKVGSGPIRGRHPAASRQRQHRRYRAASAAGSNPQGEARGAIEMAKRIKNYCSEVFMYGIAEGKCRRDPAADIRRALKKPRPKKHMAAVPPSEFPTLVARMHAYERLLQLYGSTIAWTSTDPTPANQPCRCRLIARSTFASPL